MTGALACAAIALAGCGGASSTGSTGSTRSTTTATSSAATTTASATPAQGRPIKGVASPAGAIPAHRATLTKLKRVAKGTGVKAHLAGLGQLPLTQAVQQVSGDVNHFWSSEFANSGIQWPPMQDVIVDSNAVQTQCSGRATISPGDPWYLCDGNSGGTFYWTIPWIQQNIATDSGGVNLAFSMAEMWSFHVQNLLGFTAAMQQGQMAKGEWAQQAVCLTGLYVRSLNERQLFEQGDQPTVQQFISALSAVNGIGSPDVSAQQLQQAFVGGFSSGDPATCGAGGSGGGGGNGGGGTATQTTPGTQTSGGPTTIPLGSSNG